jgi:hypothetical protein
LFVWLFLFNRPICLPDLLFGVVHAPFRQRVMKGPASNLFHHHKVILSSHHSFRIQTEEGALVCSGLLWCGPEAELTPSENRFLALDGFQSFDDDFPFVLLHVTGGRVAQITFEVVAFIEDGRLLATAR